MDNTNDETDFIDCSESAEPQSVEDSQDALLHTTTKPPTDSENKTTRKLDNSPRSPCNSGETAQTSGGDQRSDLQSTVSPPPPPDRTYKRKPAVPPKKPSLLKLNKKPYETNSTGTNHSTDLSNRNLLPPPLKPKPEPPPRKKTSKSEITTSHQKHIPQKPDDHKASKSSDIVYTATPIFIHNPKDSSCTTSGIPKDLDVASSQNTESGHNSSNIHSVDSPASTKFPRQVLPGAGLEMSVEQVLCDNSKASPVPLAADTPQTTMSSTSTAEEFNPREVSRTSSSLSGKVEESNSPNSPNLYCASPASVPRSHSDISCRLEGQNSRDSSIVSSHSRLSRASCGTDLENFFNQMGLERGVLDPISRLCKLQSSEAFDSVSSLDSQDAASICSAISRSDHDWGSSKGGVAAVASLVPQSTSVVERNARIIKWLMNVRKASNVKDGKAIGKKS